MTFLALILVAALPLYVLRFPVLGLPSTFLEVMILILTVVFLITRWPDVKKRQPFSWELVAWLIVAILALLSAGFSLSGLGIWRAYFFEPALAFIIFINVFNSKEKIIKVMQALSISAIAISLFAGYQYITGNFISNPFWQALETRRATSIFPYPNAVGLYLAPIVLMLSGAFVAVYKTEKKKAWLFATAIFASLAAIVFAQSDGALFGIAAAALLGLFFASKKTRIAAVVICIIGAGLLFASPTLSDYVLTRVALKDFSGQVRRVQWRETFKMLYDGRSVTGAGLGNYQASVKPYHQEGLFINDDPKRWQPLEIYLYPHNIALNFWSELGLLGLALFIYIVIRYFQMGIQAFERLRAHKDSFAWVGFGLILSMIAVIIHGLVDVPYFKNDLAVLFWLMVAMMGITWKKLSSKN